MIGKKINHLPALFLFGLLLVCIDIVNIDMGGFKLKLAYVGFSAYLVAFCYFYELNFNRNNMIIAMILLLSFFPSLLNTTNFKSSIAFYAGTFICLMIMFIFAKMTEKIGASFVELMILFYRFSVFLTAALVFSRMQERGHFLFYEASYYAIALIPYFCIVFYRMFNFGVRNVLFDIFLILAAISLSQSVSMFLWCFISFISFYFISGRAKLIHIPIILVFLIIFLFSIYNVNLRAKYILIASIDIINDPGKYLNILILVGGNRLQRIFIAYDAFLSHPLLGVGIGALRDYSTKNFSIDDFYLNGMTASDFSESTNATNVFMEVAAEAGVVGLIGFILVQVFICKKNGNREILLPFKIAYYITMTSLLIESSYLRTYVWALYGIIIGISSIKDDENLRWALVPNRLKRRMMASSV